jgi:hypothetical protein
MPIILLLWHPAGHHPAAVHLYFGIGPASKIAFE